MNSPEIYNNLVCPLGKFPLKVIDDMLVCTNCSTGYKFNGSIPSLVLDNAIFPDGINDYTQLACYKIK